MNEIEMNEFPQNISVDSTPVIQGWSFDPSAIAIDYIQGQDMPVPITVATKYRDIYTQGWSSQFTAMKYRSYLTTVQGLPVCVVMSGDLDPGPTLHDVDRADISGDMIYTFQNLNLLPPGTYTGWKGVHAYIGFEGDYSDVLEDRILPIKIRVWSSVAPLVTQQSFVFHRTIGQLGLILKPINISGTNWTIRCPKGFWFENPTGITITLLPDGGYEASGTGTRGFNLACTSQVEPDVITQNPLSFMLIVNGGIVQIPISLYFLQPNGLYISTDSLQFVTYKNEAPAAPQDFRVFYSTAYTITGLPWLTLSDQAGNAGEETVCTVTPMNADNMDAGVYTGKLYVKNNTGGILAIINVEYRILDFVENPYPEHTKAFTLENTMINFSSQLDNCYFELLLKAKVYDYYAATFKEYSLPYKIALFKRKQLFNISKIVHRLMPGIPDFATMADVPYLPAEVKMEVTHRKNEDPEYGETFLLENIYFVAGRQPQMIGGCGFLDVNAGASRVTGTGDYFLHMIIEGYPTLQVLKNGEEIMINSLSPGIHTRHIFFSDWLAKPGDVIEYRILIGEGLKLSKIFKVFPDGYNSNFIVWETEYKLKAAMEFTGKYSIKSDLENRTAGVVISLVDALRKVSSTKTNKLTINTGFLLKDDIAAVESLARAKRAALLVNSEIIEMVPIQKSITTVDDDRETISFDLEFEINRSHDEKVYTF